MFNTSEIILNKQNPDKSDTYKIIIYNLNYYPVGEYESYLGFFVEGIKYGGDLKLQIRVK